MLLLEKKIYTHTYILYVFETTNDATMPWIILTYFA